MGRKRSTTYRTLTTPIVVPVGSVINLPSNNYTSRTIYYSGNIELTSIPPGITEWTAHTPVGYVKANDVSDDPCFYYYVHDHLGNVCAVWSAETNSFVQKTFYYPSGVPMNISTNQAAQHNKYNGKPYEEMHGFDIYEYEARGYYATIMRFTAMDPLCEKYYSTSPYAWCANNPVNYVDPDGRDWYQSEDSTAIFWKKGNMPAIDIDGVKYHNIGENYYHTTGNTTYGYHQNELQTIEYHTNTEFFKQPTGTSCKTTCEQMVASAGYTPETSRTGEILMATHDEDGVVNGSTRNWQEGVSRLNVYLQDGEPCIVGIDYKAQQQHNLAPYGDGMTDHFITIVGMIIDVQKGSTTYRFFDPGSVRGARPSNIICVVGSFLQGRTAAHESPFKVTTVRKNKIKTAL